MDTYHQDHIVSLLDKVRIFETSLGEFGHVLVNAAGEYEIHLSNGILFFLSEELEAQVSNTLTPEMLHTIATRFKRTAHTRMHVSGGDPYTQTGRTKRPAHTRLYIVLGAACATMAIGLAFFLSTAGNANAVRQEPRLEVEDSMVPQKTDSFETKAIPKVKATEQ